MNKQELAEQILKSLAKRNGFSNWNEILNDYNKGFTSEETFKALIIAAIVEAMDAPAKEGMKAPKWLQHLNKEVRFGHKGSKQEGIIRGYHPEYGVVIFLPRKVFSSYRYVSEHLIEWPESKGVEAISDNPDWKQLRDKFFKECTETYEAGKGLNILRKVSYNIAPHDLFEWFKIELTAKEAISVPAQHGANTHYHVADNSNGFRDWLDKKKIEYTPNGHFTSILLEGNDIFKLGSEFAMYKQQAMCKSVAQPIQPSLEEKKEDLVASDINTDVSSVASHSCADSNSIEQETIICSAIHFDDGKEYEHQPKNIKTGFVVAGRRHHNCYNVLASLGQALNLEERVRVLIGVTGRDSQGFITNTDRFVDRKEGWKIAKAAGQIKHGLKVYENGDDSILISENLYSEDLY